MALPLKATDIGSLTAEYEPTTDVLYIVVGEAQPVESEGVLAGLDLDYKLDTDEPCGVTVMGYQQYGWPSRLHELAEIAAQHLSLNPETVLSVVHAAAPAPPEALPPTKKPRLAPGL
jgi:uncharacterized protein YuzE